jgi:hypothetical protein
LSFTRSSAASPDGIEKVAVPNAPQAHVSRRSTNDRRPSQDSLAVGLQVTAIRMTPRRFAVT